MSAPLLGAWDVRFAASPLWLRLVDVFTRRPPTGPVEVGLELHRGGAWEPLRHRHHLTSAGDLAFVGLGRAGTGTATTFDVRVTVTAPRTQAADPTGEPSLTATVVTWTDQSPPAPVMQRIMFFPGVDYAFAGGTPVVTGRVVDGANSPVARARVSVTETVRGVPLVESTLTDAAGWFRLPVRWSAGSTQLDAVRPPLAGSLTFTVPDDLAAIATVTVT
jgi:hypothetical protein